MNDWLRYVRGWLAKPRSQMTEGEKLLLYSLIIAGPVYATVIHRAFDMPIIAASLVGIFGVCGLLLVALTVIYLRQS